MLQFVASGLYFVQDEYNFINPLLQVGSGSGFVENGTGSGSVEKSTGSGSDRILIPGPDPGCFQGSDQDPAFFYGQIRIWFSFSKVGSGKDPAGFATLL